MQVGGAGSLVGGVGIQMNNVMSQWVGGVTEETRILYIHHCKTPVEKSTYVSWWIMVELC